MIHLRATIAAVLITMPAVAQDRPTDHDAARALAEQFAATIDADADGDITVAEMTAFGDAVFASVDVDGSGTLSMEETRDWEFGMAEMAEFRGGSQGYDVAVAMVHDIIDRDDDGMVDPAEHRDAILRSRTYADTNEDGRLDEEEFLRGFIYNIAMRNAMR